MKETSGEPTSGFWQAKDEKFNFDYYTTYSRIHRAKMAFHPQPEGGSIMPAVRAAACAAAICLAQPTTGFARGDWPEGPYKEWFQNLKRPDNAKHPHRQQDPKSLYCCGAADVVKTKFKVESTAGPHPEDQWYAWLNDTWTLIPAEKINQEYAPNGQAYLFVLAGTIQCFVRPKGGL